MAIKAQIIIKTSVTHAGQILSLKYHKISKTTNAYGIHLSLRIHIF